MAENARERLHRLMNERRRELRIRWTEVARRARMSPQNLLRVRNGDISITWEAADGIDDALDWERGGVQAILDGGDPIRLKRAQGRSVRPPVGSPEWVAYLAEELPEEDFRAVMRRLLEVKRRRQLVQRLLDADRDQSLMDRDSARTEINESVNRDQGV